SMLSHMPRKLLTRRWTDEDSLKLVKLSEDGATLSRAAAALDRHTSSVQKKARALGLKFPGIRDVRAGLRETGAIEPGRGPKHS
uniref:hypothetical protein n=1 Tax=Tardiphaga sp. TaxID=1926292 RepID=UPI0037D9EC89